MTDIAAEGRVAARKTATAVNPVGLATAWRLARRELRSGLGGFRIFLACLALGVAAIAAVGSVSDAMLAGLARDGRVLLGGDIELRLVHREAAPEARAFLEDRARFSHVAGMRAMARPVDGGDRRLVELTAVDEAYPLYGKVTLGAGGDLQEVLAKQDGRFGAVVDENLLPRLKLEIGDAVSIGDAVLEIRDVIVTQPDRSIRAFDFGPAMIIAEAALPETGLVQPGSLVQHRYRLGVEEGQVSALRQEIEAAFPDAGWRIREVSEAAPGLRRFIDRVGTFLALVGLTALLVGGVGVSNAVRAYLEGKAPVVATLRCLGAERTTILQVYLLQVLVLAGIGIAIGLVLGAALPPLIFMALASVLPVSPEIAIFPMPLLIAAGFGFLTALVFSLWPLGVAAEVRPAALFRRTVQLAGRPRKTVLAVLALAVAALAALAIFTADNRMFAVYFVCGALAAMALFQLTASAVIWAARRLPHARRPTLRLAITNLFRPGSPTGTIVMSLGLGLTVLVAVALIEGNLSSQIRDRLPDAAPGLYFIDIQPDQVEEFDRLALSVPGAEGVSRVPMIRGRISALNGVPAGEATVSQDVAWVMQGDRGLTYSATPPDTSPVVEGEWWPEDYQGPPLISVGSDIARGLGLDIGDSITINVLGRDITAEIANLRRIDWSTLGINFVFVFAPGTLEAAPHTHIAAAQVAESAESALEATITDRFQNVSSIRVKDALEAVNKILAGIGSAVRGTAAIAIIAGTLVLAGAVAAGQRHRIQEAVVLKVLGATRRDVLLAYLIEYGLLGLVTASIAAGFGSLVAYGVMTEVMQADFLLQPWIVLGTAGLAMAVTIGVGLVGTWSALGRKAATVLREE